MNTPHLSSPQCRRPQLATWLALTLLAAPVLDAAVWTVNSTERNANDNNDDPPVLSLSEVLTSFAQAGDTIVFDTAALPDTIDARGTVPVDLTITGPDTDTFALRGRLDIPAGVAVTIEDLTFSGGQRDILDRDGGGAIRNAGALTLKRCRLTDNHVEDQDGGAIENTTEGILVLEACTVSDNSATEGHGGAIANHGQLTVSQTTFTDNHVIGRSHILGGGAIRNSATGTLTVLPGTVFDTNVCNTGIGSGGAIDNRGEATLTGVTFTGNHCGDPVDNDESGSGGAVYTRTAGEASLTVDGCTFTDNASDSSGGALYARGGMTAVTGSSFTGNRAIGGDGGAVVATRDATLTLTGGTLENNTAGDDGGAFATGSGSTATLDGLTIRENTATNGGAIASSAGSQTTLTDTTVTANTATGDLRGGGGIFAEGDLTLRGTTAVTGNSATAGRGGGIYADEDTTTILDGTTVSGNSAADDFYGGGGIYTEGDLTLLDGTTVTDNHATAGNGGGIFAGEDITVSLTGTTVSENTAAGDAGGLYLDDDATLVLDATTFSTNTAGEDGGAVYARGGTTLTVTASTLTTNGSGAEGGGLYIYREATLEMTDTTVLDNTAVDAGGGVYIGRTTTATLTGVEVAGNTTTDRFADGAGVLNEGTTTLDRCLVRNNRCTGESSSGAGVANTSPFSGDTPATLTLKATTVSENTCDGDGAGILNDSSSALVAHLTVRDSTLWGNTATGRFHTGGGLYNEGTAHLINSTVSRNSGDSGGGIDNTSSGELLLAHTTVTLNDAETSGGGLRNDGTVRLTHTVLAGNAAPSSPDGDNRGNPPALSGGYNIVGDLDGFPMDQVTGDLTGNPGLAALADNGGPTLTHLPLNGSLAVAAGDPAFSPDHIGAPLFDPPLALDPPLNFDQRGAGFPRLDGRINIGAVEGSGGAVVLAVDTTDDVDNGNFDAGDRSLREAVARATALQAPATITLAPGRYDLEDGPLVVANTTSVITIKPATPGGRATIDATEESRHLNVGAGATVHLVDLTLHEGNSDGSGGSVENLGTLTATGCEFTSGHSAAGGAIHNAGGLVLEDCLFNFCRSRENAGALHNTGTAVATACTFISGQAGSNHDGGAIFNTGDLALVRCTIAGNRARNGAGIAASGGSTTTLDRCYVGLNAADVGGGAIHTSGAAAFTAENTLFPFNSADVAATVLHTAAGEVALTFCTWSVGNQQGPGLSIANTGSGRFNIGHCLNALHPGSKFRDDAGASASITSLGWNVLRFMGSITPGPGDQEATAFLRPSSPLFRPPPAAPPRVPRAIYLGPASPGIDAGDPALTAASLPDTDVYGNPRIAGGRVDAGAVEVPTEVTNLDTVLDIFFDDTQLDDPATAAPDADPDKDTVPNAAEAVSGGSPAGAGDPPPVSPAADTADKSAGGLPDLLVRIDERMTFLTARLQTSPDGQAWTTVAAYKPLGAGAGYSRTTSAGLTEVAADQSGYVWTVRESLPAAVATPGLLSRLEVTVDP